MNNSDTDIVNFQDEFQEEYQPQDQEGQDYFLKDYEQDSQLSEYEEEKKGGNGATIIRFK